MPQGPKDPETLPPLADEERNRVWWEIALYQYVAKREWQTFSAIAETEKLFDMVREETNDLYRVADRVETWGYVVKNHPVEDLVQRLAGRGYGRDVTAQRLLKRIPSPTFPLTATVLRELAATILRAVEYENISLTDCKDYLEGIRDSKQPGRRPKSAFHVLLVRATNQGFGDAELAWRLVDAGVEPEKPPKRRTDDPVERWRAIIKAARRRYRLKVTKSR